MKKYLSMLIAALFAAVSYAMIVSGDREVRVSDSENLVLQNAQSISNVGVKQGKVSNSSVVGAHRVQGDHDAMITEVPTAAVVRYYNRSGYYHQVSNNYAVAEQSGITAIAFDGNDVYIQNIIAGYENNIWVKGTLNGKTITVPLGQFVMWNSGLGYGHYITMVNVNGNSYTNDTEATEITYTLNGNTIRQNGTSAQRTLAVAWSDDDTVYAYSAPGGEYGTVFTLNSEYVPAPTVLVELPEGAEAEQWYAEGIENSQQARVAFVGNDVYISGIFGNFPDSWLKGTISGSTVTFKKLQYLGDYNSYHIWAAAANLASGALEDIVMAYDAEAGTLTLDANQALIANASDLELNYFSILYTLKLMKEPPAPLTIDELPYVNEFTEFEDEKWDELKVIDANSDGVTWTHHGNVARLKWNNNYDDDDWLVSPLLKLKAGRTYKVSLEARCHNNIYPETFEVKAAQEQSAAALKAGHEVIPATVVTSTDFVRYENDEFTVPEDGYYCIGIHGITGKANAYYLYVDDFTVEDVTSNLSTYTYSFVQALNGWTTIDADNDGYTWELILNENAPGHGGKVGMVTSASYANQQALFPDNYLVSPKMKLDGKIRFYASAQDKDFHAEHFGVAVSTASGTNPADFQMVSEEWEMAASRRAQGNWYMYEVDLSSFAGAEGYVAIRHYNSYDKFRLNVDDITLVTSQLIDPYDPELEVEPVVADPEVVVLPEGAEVYQYSMAYINLSSNSKDFKPINVAVVGNEVYFQGMSQYLPEAWVKGTMNGNRVTFPAMQFMGEYEPYGESYFFYNGAEVFTYNADADTYSATGEMFGVVSNYYDGRYKDPVLRRVSEVAAVPAKPTITSISGSSYGDVVYFNIPTVDVNGNAMVTTKLSYQFFVDNENTPLEFTTEYFTKLTENMTVIPYGFTDNYDFLASYIFLNMPHNTWKRLGMQTIYTGGGEENKSEIFWYEISMPVTAPSDLVTETYIFKSNAFEYSSGGDIERPDYTLQVQVGFYGDDVYIKGLAADVPELWVKATKNGEGKYVIPASQYMGELIFWSYTFPYYFTALDAENNLVDAVLTFDAETSTFTTEQTLALNGAANALEYYLLFNDVIITKFLEVAATPANPSLDNFVLDNRVGYTKIYNTIPAVDTKGNTLSTSKLFYTVWYEKNGNVQPYTFTSSLYASDFVEDVTEVPYNHEGYDIYKCGDIIFLEESVEELRSWTNVGIQSIYYGGGERRESGIVWKDGHITGISEVNTVAQQRNAIYNLSGQRVVRAQNGIYIINGRKVVVR